MVGTYTDKVMRAVLQYRNTPMQDSRRSPAQMVFGQQMRDFIPSLAYKYEPAKDWAISQEHRERTFAIKREMDHQRWSYRTKDLDKLEVGTAVAIQNQTGQNPTKWDKTGVIIENKPNSKVMIRVDGSRRVTLKNRQFVRHLQTGLRTTSHQGSRQCNQPRDKTSPRRLCLVAQGLKLRRRPRSQLGFMKRSLMTVLRRCMILRMYKMTPTPPQNMTMNNPRRCLRTPRL